MALDSAQIGANLKVWKGSGLSKRLGLVMNQFFRVLGHIKGTPASYVGDTPNFAIFVKAGAPVTNTAADSPGRNLCFIWDSTNKALYFVHTWSAVGTFTVLKVID